MGMVSSKVGTQNLINVVKVAQRQKKIQHVKKEPTPAIDDDPVTVALKSSGLHRIPKISDESSGTQDGVGNLPDKQTGVQAMKMERASTCPKSLLAKVGFNPMSLLEDFLPTMLQQPQL